MENKKEETEKAVELSYEQILEKRTKKTKLIGILLILIGFISTCYFSDWKIALSIFLMLWGNNLEASSKIIKVIFETLSEKKINNRT